MSSSLGGGRAAGRRGRPAGRGVGPAVREQWLKPPPARLSSQVDLAISVAELSIEEKAVELSPEEERRQWEEGRIDYLGKDAFARIQEKLDRFLQ